MPLIYFIPIRTASGAIVYIADTSINQTPLLLSSSGASTSYTTDASSNNFDISLVGTPTPSNNSPFSTNWSGYFGTNNYLNYAGNTALSFGTGDFTLESWIWISAPSDSPIYEGRANGTGTAAFTLTAFSSSVIRVWTGSAALISSVGTTYINKWTHVAVVRASGTTTLYIDGVSAGSAATLGNLTENIALVGAGRYASTSTVNKYFAGYISNFRMVKGTAVYTANFTPTTSPLTAISGTSLLTLQNGSFKDNSTNAFTPTVVGAPSLTKFSPFAGTISTDGSGYFNGTTTSLNAGSNAAFAFGTGDFTVEAWVYSTSATQPQYIFINDATGGFGFGFEAGNFLIGKRASTTDLTYAYTIPLNRWVHYAASRQGTTARLFINGVQVATNTNSIDYTITGPASIGGIPSATGNAIIGNISNLRVVKGTAVYTANFTPPTSSLTAVSGTSLLTLQNNTPNNTNAFLSSAPNSTELAVVRTGNARTGSVNPYTFNYSVYFNGSSDYLSGTLPTGGLGSGNFTIEAWVYQTVTLVNQNIVDTRGVNASTTGLSVQVDTSNRPILFTSSTIFTSTGTITPNVWTHLAFVRDSGTITCYINGVASGTLSASTNYSDTALVVGSNQPKNNWFTGYISNLRMVVGSAVYTTNFTPSTSPLETVSNTVLLTCQTARFVDNSPRRIAITPTSGPQVQPFNPFSMRALSTPASYSAYFNGSSDYLSVASNSALNLKNFDFTIECWVYPLSSTYSTYQTLFTKRVSGATTTSYEGFLKTGTGVISFYNGTEYNSTTTLTPNTWSHCAWVYTNSNSTLNIYVNGAVVYTVVVTLGNDNTEPLTIGFARGGTQYFNGYISNFRMVKGTAVYASAFTPSNSMLSSVSGTSLLTCQSSRFVDNSSNAFAITATGAPVPSTQNPFRIVTSAPTGYVATTYEGSMFFDGTGDYLTVSNPPEYLRNWWVHTGFTVEAWVYVNTLTQDATNAASPMVGHVAPAATTHYWTFGPITNGTVKFTYNNVTVQNLVTTTTIGTKQWHHLAFVKNGTSLTIYINGVSSATATISGTPQSLSTTPILVGAYNNVVFNGYITDLKISNSAMYTTNFVPPTAPLSSTSSTLLLLNPSAQAIVDSTAINPIDVVGQVKVSNNIVKYGNSSIYLNGSSYCTLPYTTALNIPKDFTVECWAYPVAKLTSFPCIVNNYSTNGANGGFAIFAGHNTGGSTKYNVAFNGALVINSSTATVVYNQWVHLAVVRSGSTITLYVDGVANGTSTQTAALVGTANNWWIGTAGDTIATGYFNGYVSDLRVTRAARYTANFTPPTAALPT